MRAVLILILCLSSLNLQAQSSEPWLFEQLGRNLTLPAPGELFRFYAVSSPDTETVSMQIQAIPSGLTVRYQGYAYSLGPVKFWIVPAIIPAQLDQPELRLSLEARKGSHKKSLSSGLECRKTAFHAETIPLSKAMSNLRTIADPQKTKESQHLHNLLQQFDSLVSPSSTGFGLPIDIIRQTAFFGDRRIYAYNTGLSEKSLHWGLDYGGNNLRVRSSSAGRVVFAQNRIVTGNTIVIQHAPGLFSLYYHLSKLAVSSGQSVSSAQLIGFSGATGLVTGPHLHWEIRNQGQAANPEALVAHEHIDIESLSRVLSLPLLP